MPLYVYALVAPPPTRAPRLRCGIARERPRVLKLGPIGAIVGDISARPDASADAIRAHDALVRQLARVWAAVLPVRFGSVVDEERSLRELISNRRAALVGSLARVRGRAQMTVRVFGPKTQTTADAPVHSGGPGTQYLKRAADLDAQARRLPEFDPIRRALGTFVHDERVIPHDSPPLVASVFHLIDRRRARAYTRAARAAAAGASLRIAVSGPFPPYAFGPDDL